MTCEQCQSRPAEKEYQGKKLCLPCFADVGDEILRSMKMDQKERDADRAGMLGREALNRRLGRL